MEILYTLNLCTAFVLLFWPVWFARSQLKLSWVNPFTITLAVAIPVQVMKLIGGPLVLIDDGLFDKGYQFALLMGNVQILAQTAGLVFFLYAFRYLRIEHYLPLQRSWIRPAGLWRGALLFLLLFAAAFYLLASAEFGLINWLANPREGYQLYRTGQGHWYALAVSFLSVSFVLALLAHPRPWAVMVLTIVYVALAYLLGSKGTLLSFFATTLVFLWFLRWPYLARLFAIGMPVLFAMLLVNLFLALGDGFDLQAILEYFDYYKNAANYYHAYLDGEVPLFWGEVSFSSLWAYAPRAIWPDKPTVYGILLVNEIFYPGQADMTNTPAFGGAVEQFADFGVPGVLLFSFFSAQSLLTALMSHLVFTRPGLRFHQVSVATVLLLLVQYAPAFGSFFPAGLYLGLLLLVMGLIRLAGARLLPRHAAPGGQTQRATSPP